MSFICKPIGLKDEIVTTLSRCACHEIGERGAPIPEALQRLSRIQLINRARTYSGRGTLDIAKNDPHRTVDRHLVPLIDGRKTVRKTGIY